MKIERQKVLSRAKRLGADIAGVARTEPLAEVGAILREPLEGARSAIVLGVRRPVPLGAQGRSVKGTTYEFRPCRRTCSCETSIAETNASDVAFRCGNRAIQVFGAYERSNECRGERYARDAGVANVLEGTARARKLIIGRYATGMCVIT